MIGKNQHQQQGMVSLFAVIFSMLLITVVTIGFSRIMIVSQQQSTSDDLSQSAYDSALVGVEDAKRAILKYKNTCATDSTSEECIKAKAAIYSSSCNDSVKILSDINNLVDTTSGEVKIQTTTSNGTDSNTLNQAYTCVKVTMDTADYLGYLANNESKFISLKGTDTFNTITVQWYNSQDLGSNILGTLNSSSALVANWGSDVPPIMRTQLFELSNKNGFKIGDIDSRTLFLYPSKTGSNVTSFVFDDRTNLSSSSKSSIIPLTKCSLDSLNSDGYACSMKITLPSVIDTNSSAYLYLTALYNKSHYRITLSNSDTDVKFDAVQPEIDSTGRANTLFRRVSARVELTNANYPYPSAAVNISGNFCKNFTITNNPNNYISSCTP